LNKSPGLESHPFSIASSNLENNLKIIVKNFGDFTSEFKNLKVGDEVLVDGPFGYFSYNNFKNKNQIWIAGGIGITPFLSMIKNLDKVYNIDFYYSVKEDKEAIHLSELQDISQKNSNLKFISWVSSKMGYIKGETISSMSKGLKGKEIFLCGPSGFMESLKDQFVSLGVDIKKIHYENFSL
jgi:predicted ferric reductase